MLVDLIACNIIFSLILVISLVGCPYIYAMKKDV